MENIVFGVLTILLCSTGYFFAWKAFKKGDFRFSSALIIVCGIGFYVYCSTDFFLHIWDERYHALVSKNLMKHYLVPTLYDNPILPYNYQHWVANHIWLHKQPFPLWTMATSMHLFGVNEIGVRLPSIILSSIGIALTYHVGKYFFDQKTGLIAAFLFSINGLIIELTSGRIATDHIDIFFMFLILLSIFLTIQYIKSGNPLFTLLIGVTVGAAILTKWLTALIVLPIWILMTTDSKRYSYRTLIIQFALLIATIIVISLPWQIYIHHAFPLEAAWESSFNYKHFTEVIEDRDGPFYYFIAKIGRNYGELIYLPLIWFFWEVSKNLKNRKRLALVVWFLIPLLIFSTAKTKMQGYLLFTAPALFAIISKFYWVLLQYVEKSKQKRILQILALLLLALPVRYTIERIKPFEYRDRNPQWVQELRDLHAEQIKNGILLNYAYPTEAMFYTDLTVYTSMPEKEVILDLLKQDYTVLINDVNVPEEIKAIEGIVLKKLKEPEL